jgi:hypothetical protein
MKTENQASRSYFKTVFSIADEMKPLKQKKNPAVAATLGLFTGGVGLGIYLGTWFDFFLPFLMLLLIFILSGGILTELVPIFWAVWGWRRAKASNAKLDAGGSTERILEAEVITEPPPLPAVHRVTDSRNTPEARLRQADDLFRGGSISQSERDEKRRQILHEI